ncbi:MAG: TatD family hydrolase [bacterium]|nr:TatD family hydrolase [bacterium]
MLIDIGLNLGSPRYESDRDAVLARGLDAGVSHFILTGTSLRESAEAIRLARVHAPHCLATAGIHPHEASTLDAAGLESLRALLRQPGVVAVGETGLDFNRNFSTPAEQEQAFVAQIGLAEESGLPLFLHERDASERMTEILQSHRGSWSDGVLHCFTGNRQALHDYLDMGLYIGITGWVCDERRGRELQELVKEIPGERLLLESDGPYLLPRDLPQPPRDKRNEPMYLPHIAATVARLRGVSVEALGKQTSANAKRLFRFSWSGCR